MAGWKKTLNHLAYDIETRFDQFKYALEMRLGGPGPIKIIAYNGFGRPDRLYLKGRVLEDKKITSARDDDNLFDNVLNMYRRLNSHEVPYAHVLARFGNVEQEVTANEEGFFDVWIEPEKPLKNPQLWQEVQLRLLSPLSKDQPEAVEATGKVLIPPPTAQFAVISDIDDTVVRTDAAHMLRMARNVFLGNAQKRLPFPGVAAFYRALLDGPHGNDLNPLFYVSSTPWNLYDLMVDFFRLRDIPLGPVLFLRDWGLTENEVLPVRNRDYKIQIIRMLIDFYPQLPFILIGDSGQEDPEIYQEITASYPDRVNAVYIRNVSHDLSRPEAIRALAEKVVQAHSTLILGDDTYAMAKHAASQGWIAEQALGGIEAEKKQEQEPATPLEKLMQPENKPEAPTVKVEGETTGQTQQAVKDSAIEQALEDGKKVSPTPPTVIVQPKSKEQPDAGEQTKEEKGE